MKNTTTILSLSLLLLFAGCNAKNDPAPAPEAPAATAQSADASQPNADGVKNAPAPADSGAKADVPAGDDVQSPFDSAQDNTPAAPSTVKGTVASDKFMQVEFQPVIEGTVCNAPEGCDFGGTYKCPMNATMTADQQCYCGKTLVREGFESYACIEIAKGIYDLGCTESSGCPCRDGKIKTYSNMGCSGYYATCAGAIVPGRGLSCTAKPYQNWLYSLKCFNDECTCYDKTISKGEICPPLVCERGYSPSPNGCACNGKLDDGKSECVLTKDGKLAAFCTSPDGCECGETTCPTGPVCRHNKCVDRITHKEIPEGYEMHFGIPRCAQQDDCACGKKGKCANGKYCLNGTCYGDPYTRRIGDKVYYYHLFTKDIADAGPKEPYRNALWSLLFVDMTLPTEGNPARPICTMFSSVREKGKPDDLCKSDAHSNISIEEILTRCGTGEIPEKVAAMYCTLDVVDGALEFSGWENE